MLLLPLGQFLDHPADLLADLWSQTRAEVEGDLLEGGGDFQHIVQRGDALDALSRIPGTFGVGHGVFSCNAGW